MLFLKRLECIKIFTVIFGKCLGKVYYRSLRRTCSMVWMVLRCAVFASLSKLNILVPRKVAQYVKTLTAMVEKLKSFGISSTSTPEKIEDVGVLERLL